MNIIVTKLLPKRKDISVTRFINTEEIANKKLQTKTELQTKKKNNEKTHHHQREKGDWKSEQWGEVV